MMRKLHCSLCSPAASSSASSPCLPSLLRRLRSGRQLSQVRERLLAVLALHTPLDGLSQHTAAAPSAAISTHGGADSAGRQQQQRDERKEKSRWDADAPSQHSDDDEADDADSSSGSVTSSNHTTATEQQRSAELEDVASEAAQHSAHRDRDLLRSSWSAMVGSSTALSVWDDCFASSFNSRCQELVQASFARFKFHETIERTLQQWDAADSESASVESAAAGWSAAAASSMWSGYRQSAVTALVSSFATQLERLAADVRHLLNCSLAATVRQATAQQASSVPNLSSSAASAAASPLLYPFDYLSFLSLPRFLDDDLSPSLHRLYTASVHSMAEQLKRRLTQLETSVQQLMASETSWRSSECRMLVERAVFIGRCCASITQQTAFASFSQALQQQPSALQPHSSHSHSHSQPPPLLASSSPIVAALSSTARSAFHIWSRYVANTVSDEMETAFTAWRKAADNQQRTLQQGQQQQQSQPTVPSQPSAYIHRVLWTVQQHTYSTHGYRVTAEVLRYMMQDTAIASTAVIMAQLDVSGHTDPTSHNDSDSDFTEHQHHQQQQRQRRVSSSSAPFAASPLSVVLQLYFDLLFLMSMLRLPDAASGQSGLAVLDHVDHLLAARMPAPEWSALRSSVVSSCVACLQRTQLLFGLLVKRNPLPPMQMPGRGEAALASSIQSAVYQTNNTTSAAATAAHAAGAAGSATVSTGGGGASSAASGLALAPTSSRIMTFSTSFYTHNHTHIKQQHQQQQLKPHSVQPHPPQQPRSSSSINSSSTTSTTSTGSTSRNSAASPVPVAVSASYASSGSSVAANAASVASESAALLKEKGRQLLGKWNLV